MPLSPAAPREHIHTRTVTCRGYRREDGLWDIEGHLVDVKSYTFANKERGEIVPGDPIHEMWIRVTVDDRLTIVAIEAATDKSPYGICPTATDAYAQLVGLRMSSGFTIAVKERVGGAAGCTHLTELMRPIATTAFQTIFPIIYREHLAEQEAKTKRRPPLLDTCHAFARTSPVVRDQWPDYYTEPTDLRAIGD